MNGWQFIWDVDFTQLKPKLIPTIEYQKLFPPFSYWIQNTSEQAAWTAKCYKSSYQRNRWKLVKILTPVELFLELL